MLTAMPNTRVPRRGSEANEAAIRIARRYSGKSKIINHYRSYHGGSPGSLSVSARGGAWGVR